MSSKSSKNWNKRCDNFGLGTPHRRSRAREAPTHRTKDREKMGNLRKTSPDRKKIRTMGRQRNIMGSGGTSILRTPRIRLFIVAQRSHWWLR
jgi:hypothetical protein